MSAAPSIVIVSGMSGAGRSTMLRALEDLEYYCIDNAPPALVGEAVEECLESDLTQVALGLGVRAGRLHDGMDAAVEALQNSGHPFTLVFLDAKDDALLRRFSSTRRPHPLESVSDGGGNKTRAVLDAVLVERQMLAPLRAQAHQLIDTTDLSVHELRKRVIELFGGGRADKTSLQVRCMSFGFKYGSPIDADLVFDVRFLDNPFFVEGLRPMSGLDAPVREFVLGRPETSGFLDRAVDLLCYTLPLYRREGKRYLTIGVGCTGGRHRSVALAEKLSGLAGEKSGFEILVVHRDIDREGS